MAEMANIDPNFEPQSRPRSGTWPLNRPNIPPRRNRMLEMGVGTLLGATLEEANSQELIAGEPSMLLETPPMMKDDYLPMLSPDSMLNSTDLDMLIGLPSAPTANFVEDFPLSASLVKPEPGNISNILGNYCTTTTITELSNLNENQSFDEVQNLQCQSVSTSANFSPGGNITPLSISPTTTSTTVSSTQSTPSTSTGATPKTKSTRKNAWGNMSYADLITQGIESAPDKRLTLAQVYEWMVKNVPYFKDKGDSNSSAGWKNSIRHNLSLHAKFKRIQNEGTGKSSWWVINHEAKPGKPTRRRAISMDNGNQKYNRSRNKVMAKHKAELIKKQKPGLKTGETATWGCDGTSGLETTVSKALGSEYRQRTCSNASTGRLSPTHLFPPQDLEDNGAPSLSPLGSATNLSNLGTSLPSAFDIFNVVRPENASSTIPENNEMLHDNLLTSLANMDVVSPPVPYGDQQQVDSKSAIYLQQMTDTQQTPKRKNLGSNVAQNSPNLASLLQGGGKSTPKKNPTPMTKREPEWAESKIPFGYSDYQNTQMMNQVLQSPSQYKPQLSEAKPMYRYVVPSCSSIPEGGQYTQQGRLQQRPQVNYIQQQQAEIQQYLANQQIQQQMVPMENQPPPLYPGEGSNLVQMSGKFPSDINIEPYDSGDLDMAEVLKDMPPSNDSYTFEVMDFDGKPASFYQQTRMQESNDYNMGLNGNDGLLQQQQQRQAPPVRHPNPDVFIANPGPGTTSMDLMEGCRMNNTANFQCMQPGQTPSVGAASSYTMQ